MNDEMQQTTTVNIFSYNNNESDLLIIPSCLFQAINICLMKYYNTRK